MIKNIIFDIGGIICDDGDQNLIKILKKDIDSVKAIKKLAYGGNFKKCMLGEMSLHEHLDDLKNKQVKDYELIEYILTSDNFKYSYPVIYDTVNVIKNLKKEGYKIYLLSNIIEESFIYLTSNIDLSEICDGGLYSYQEHLIKPDKEIYERILNKYNLDKNETIFFDDVLKNVIAARELGIKSVQYNSVNDIYDNL